MDTLVMARPLLENRTNRVEASPSYILWQRDAQIIILSKGPDKILWKLLLILLVHPENEREVQPL